MNGVIRCPMASCNLLHVDDLIVVKSSIAAFGNAENASSAVSNAYALIECFWQRLFKMAMQDVVQGTGIEVPLKIVRERQQRWLVNQQLDSWVMKSNPIVTSDDVSCLAA